MPDSISQNANSVTTSAASRMALICQVSVGLAAELMRAPMTGISGVFVGRTASRRRPRSRLVPLALPLPVSGPQPDDGDDERQRQEEDKRPVELIEPLQPGPDIE